MGTALDMDAQTTILIKESDRRTVYLDQGQLHAKIPHGRSMPMDVVVHGILLRDLGTEFNVAAHDDGVALSLTSGKMQVIELHSDGSQENPINIKEEGASQTPAFLVPGDLARLERRHGAVLMTRDGNNLNEARNRSSWIEGRLKTSGQRLDEVLWEMNVRNKVFLVSGNSTTAQMSIGGTYDLMRVNDFLKTARLLGLEIDPRRRPEKKIHTPTYILRRPPDDNRRANRHR